MPSLHPIDLFASFAYLLPARSRSNRRGAAHVVLLGAIVSALAIGVGASSKASRGAPRETAPLTSIVVTRHYDIAEGNDYAAGPQPFRVRGWDTALGTLDSVTIRIHSKGHIVTSVENLNVLSPCCANAGEHTCTSPTSGSPNKATITILDRDSNVLARHTKNQASLTANLAVYDGTTDYAGASGAQMDQENEDTDSSPPVFTDSATKSYFTGTSVQLEFERATVESEDSDCGMVAYAIDAKASGWVEVDLTGH